MQKTTIFVSKTDPRAAFTTIAEALAALGRKQHTPATILLDAGVYHEKLSIQTPYVTLEGVSSAQTVITWHDYGLELMPDGVKRGTFFSYTLLVDAPRVTLKNLTVENSSGSSVSCGQAIALYADGDFFTCTGCRLIGKQDTLFIGPLPEKEYELGGFRGPKEHAPRVNTRQYYRGCYICGDVDFIFGSGSAFFEDCTLHSLLRDETKPVQGFVTAASTPPGQEYGFVFSHCALTGECPPQSVYLGRPWRDYAKTVFLSCTYGAHIHPLGFDDWEKAHARETVLFAEFDCKYFGQNSDSDIFKERAPFVRALSAGEAARHEALREIVSATP